MPVRAGWRALGGGVASMEEIMNTFFQLHALFALALLCFYEADGAFSCVDQETGARSRSNVYGPFTEIDETDQSGNHEHRRCVSTGPFWRCD